MSARKRTCVVCRSSLEGKRADARYCGANCRKRAQRGFDKTQRVCEAPGCISAIRPEDARYCCENCKKRAERQARNAPARRRLLQQLARLTEAEIKAIDDRVKDGSEARQVLDEEIARHRPPRKLPAVVRGRIARKPSSGAVDTGIRDYISMYCTGGPVWPRDCGWALAAQDELRAAHLADELAEVEPEVEAEVVSLDQMREAELEAELDAVDNDMAVAA